MNHRSNMFFPVLFFLVLLSLTLVPVASAQPLSQAASCEQTYVVQAGDWLSTIAQRYLGDANAYNVIVVATNAAAQTDPSFATLSDPNSIEVGQKLCIPAATSVPGRENAGIYTTVGPAADASALVETLVLGPDGRAIYSLDYVGKSKTDAEGTWAQEGISVTVQLTQQGGQPTQQTMTFTVVDGNLVTTTEPPTTYTKTPANVAFYSGLYTTNRNSADGSQTLVALTLYPNGTADMNITEPSGTLIVQSGTWTEAPNPDTGSPTITVHLTDQGGQAIDETFAFQVQDNLLRGTQYNTDKWGTDLTFTKFVPPAQPETPATAEQANAVGSYTAQLPAADAVGRVIVLDLVADNSAAMTTQFIGKGDPTVDSGTWELAAGNISVTLTTASSGVQPLVFQPVSGTLVLQDPVAAGYGTDGLTLTKTPSGQTNLSEFGGVSISFDQQLAQSAEGSQIAAVPVTEGPALGGATPAAVRFLFNGQQPDEFFNPQMGQVLVYKAEDWSNLDPTTAQAITDLKQVLATQPVSFTEAIPVLPPFPATQVFRVKPTYLDFQNGSGIGFVTYYAQDVSPVTNGLVFYTFQGLTTDGKYYVSIFYPVSTAYLPTDPEAALGGQTYDQWAANYQQYLTDLVAGLDGLVPAAYTPNLALIEELVKSVNVDATTLEQ